MMGGNKRGKLYRVKIKYITGRGDESHLASKWLHKIWRRESHANIRHWNKNNKAVFQKLWENYFYGGFYLMGFAFLFCRMQYRAMIIFLGIVYESNLKFHSGIMSIISSTLYSSTGICYYCRYILIYFDNDTLLLQ